jgi:hypothetical protein
MIFFFSVFGFFLVNKRNFPFNQPFLWNYFLMNKRQIKKTKIFMIMGFSLLFFMYKKLLIKIEFKIFIRKILLITKLF